MPIGILAYGSLIGDPGSELGPLVEHRIPVDTPFAVEFARLSSSREQGPTLIPFPNGWPVRGRVLALASTVTMQEACSMLWRREIRQEGSGRVYVAPASPGMNRVVVERCNDLRLEGVDPVIRTRIGCNIQAEDLGGSFLAKRAIASLRRLWEKGAPVQQSGIPYLAAARRYGIVTPLSEEYEAAILNITGASTLTEAIDRVLASME